MRKGDWVYHRDRPGRVGRISKAHCSYKPKMHEVQFGADGPFEIISEYQLRRATQAQIDLVMGVTSE